MSENIEGGIYGAEVEADVAASLVVGEVEVAAEPTEAPSEPNGEEATVEGQTQEIEQPVESEIETPPVDTSVEVDGKSYSLDDIRLAIDDSRNRSDWQKSNTQKAQQLSDDRKALTVTQKKFDDLKKDEDLMETLKDYLGEDHTLFQETDEPNENAQTQDTKDPIDNRIQELEDKIEMQEAQQAVERDIQVLIKNHPELDGKDNAVREVLNTAINKGMSNLEDAFVLTYHKAAVDSSFSKAVKTLKKADASKSIPEASVKHKGSKSLSNVKPENFDEARAQALKYDLYE
jgi:hypothetical protein|tara:strand:- start:1489 stop:2355 length:867 start_codon:yes stop_codon:yes gene_type:complete